MPNTKLDCPREGLMPRHRSLEGNSAHKVEGHVETRSHGGGYAIRGKPGRMHTTKAPELKVIKALDANRDARRPGGDSCAEDLVCQRLRIRLKAQLANGRSRANGRNERREALGTKHRRRATAQVGGLALPKESELASLFDQVLKRGCIGRHKRVIMTGRRR